MRCFQIRFFCFALCLGLLSLAGCNQPGKFLITAPFEVIDPLPIEAPKLGASKDQNKDPQYKDQWNLTKVEAGEAVWKEYQGSRSITLMLVGTGVDYNNPEIRNNILVNQTEIKARANKSASPLNQKDDDNDGLIDNLVGWDVVQQDGLAYDQAGYDTLAAGIIGAAHNNKLGIKGIVKNISMYPLRYIDKNGRSKMPLLLNALIHILKIKPQVVLLNLINVPFHQVPKIAALEKYLLKMLLEKLYLAKIPIVVGAGNLGLPIDEDLSLLTQFAKYKNVLVVSGTQEDDTKAPLANFSRKYVDIFAPSEDIITTGLQGKIEKRSGTYLAAAHVAGALALAISHHHKDKDYLELYEALTSSKGSDENTSWKSYSKSFSRLNIKKFLMALK